MIEAGRIIIIGCGNMGSALLKGAIGLGVDVVAVEKNEQRRKDLIRLGVSCEVVDKVVEVRDWDMIVFAVKPQDIEIAAGEVSSVCKSSKICVLSVAAGISLSFFKERLQADGFVRAMPNTPGLLRAGITAIFSSGEKWAVESAVRLLEELGDVVRLDREDDIDVVTAISGSGPAYFFLLCELLTDFGKEMGLSEEVADLLSRKTCFGAGIMLNQMNLSAKELRQMVTSKGGTTEAAICYMTEEGLCDILKNAFARAYERARQLRR